MGESRAGGERSKNGICSILKNLNICFKILLSNILTLKTMQMQHKWLYVWEQKNKKVGLCDTESPSFCFWHCTPRWMSCLFCSMFYLHCSGEGIELWRYMECVWGIKDQPECTRISRFRCILQEWFKRNMVFPFFHILAN
jgi:hypothetical protein